VSTIVAGEIIIRSGNNQTFLAVSGGLAQINSDQVKILVNTAERAQDIDEARAEQAHQRALQLMTEKRDDVDYTALASKIEKELTRMHVARKRKHHTAPTPHVGE
jgi:F-type H+-transporting ATPase subunit epsilon